MYAHVEAYQGGKMTIVSERVAYWVLSGVPSFVVARRCRIYLPGDKLA